MLGLELRPGVKPDNLMVNMKNVLIALGIALFIASLCVAYYMGQNGATKELTLWCAGLMAIGLSLCSALSIKTDDNSAK